MIQICTNQEGEFVFSSDQQEYILLDLNNLQEQLDEGKKQEILDLLQQVMQSNEYNQSNEKVKSQVEWALQTANDHMEEVFDAEQYIENQRYPEVHSANKMIDYNIDKVKARVQFMSLQERRNLVKTKSLERSMQQIFICKQNRYEKEMFKRHHQLLQNDIISRKRSEIQIARQKHFQNLQNVRGKLGQMLQSKIEETKQLKQTIQSGFYQTLTELRSDNVKAYRRVKVMERQQQEKMQQYWQQKQIIAKENYKKKVENAYMQSMFAQDRLQQLEQQETQLMHRLRQTEQLYQLSSNKLEQLKTKSYKDLGNMWNQ